MKKKDCNSTKSIKHRQQLNIFCFIGTHAHTMIFHYLNFTCIKTRKDSTISQSIVKSWNVITVVSGINSSILYQVGHNKAYISHFLFISNPFKFVVGILELIAIWKSFSYVIRQCFWRGRWQRERENI